MKTTQIATLNTIATKLLSGEVTPAVFNEAVAQSVSVAKNVSIQAVAFALVKTEEQEFVYNVITVTEGFMTGNIAVEAFVEGLYGCYELIAEGKATPMSEADVVRYESNKEIEALKKQVAELTQLVSTQQAQPAQVPTVEQVLAPLVEEPTPQQMAQPVMEVPTNNNTVQGDMNMMNTTMQPAITKEVLFATYQAGNMTADQLAMALKALEVQQVQMPTITKEDLFGAYQAGELTADQLAEGLKLLEGAQMQAMPQPTQQMVQPVAQSVGNLVQGTTSAVGQLAVGSVNAVGDLLNSLMGVGTQAVSTVAGTVGNPVVKEKVTRAANDFMDNTNLVLGSTINTGMQIGAQTIKVGSAVGQTAVNTTANIATELIKATEEIANTLLGGIGTAAHTLNTASYATGKKVLNNTVTSNPKTFTQEELSDLFSFLK